MKKEKVGCIVTIDSCNYYANLINQGFDEIAEEMTIERYVTDNIEEYINNLLPQYEIAFIYI